MDAIGVEDAVYLKTNIKSLEFKGNINIHGSVIAVSEIFRIKDDFVTLVKLKGSDNSCVTIMALHKQVSNRGKDGKLLPINQSWQNLQAWREELKINQGAVISRLKLTIVLKGTSMEETIFRTDKESICIFKDNEESVNDYTLEDWFYKYLKKIISTKRTCITELEAKEPITQQLVVGTVTGCDDAAHGVYELDKTRSLYLTRIPSEACFESIRPGARISVSIHHAIKVCDERTIIFGCVHSNVQVLQHPDKPCESMPFRPSTSSVSSLLSYHSICNRQLYEIINLEKSIIERFKLSKNRNRAGLILHSLLSKPLLCSKDILQQKKEKRNIIAEFLFDDCLETQECGLPCLFPTIADILITNPLDDCEADRPEGWSTKCFKSNDFNPPQVLVGVLHTNKNTGQIELQDSSGHISTVISCDKNHQDDHLCSDIRGRTTRCLNVAEQMTQMCPYAQTWLLEHVVRIDSYEIVVETFSWKGDPGGSNFTKCYVQFSAKDIVICDNVEPKIDQQFSASAGKKRKHEQANKRDTKLPHKTLGAMQEDCRSKTSRESDSMTKSNEELNSLKSNANMAVDGMEKLSLSSSVKTDLTGEKRVAGDSETEPLPVETNLKSSQMARSSLNPFGDGHERGDGMKPSSCCAYLIVQMKEGLQVKQFTSTSYELFFNLIGLRIVEKKVPFVRQTNATSTGEKQPQWVTGIGTQLNATDSASQMTHTQQENCSDHITLEPICLTIRGAQIRFYEVFHPGCVYRFTVDNTVRGNVFISNVPANLKGKKLTKTFTLNETCKVERIDNIDDLLLPSASLESVNKEMMEVLTVAEVLKSRFSPSSSLNSNPGSNQALVSVKGVVQSKHMKVEDKSGSSFPQKKLVHSLGLLPSGVKVGITLRDQQSSDEVHLEFPHGHPYALGVLPGAEVIASHIAKRRTNGVNHLQFVAVSSIKVSGRSSEIIVTSKKSVNLPKMSIFQVWNVAEISEIHFRCVVFVSVVLKLTLNPVCMHCSSQFQQGQCIGRGCTSNAGVIKSEALLISDDGTCKALIFCKGNTVQGLLGISGQAWIELEEYLLLNGGFYYDKGSPINEVSPVYQMLQESCINGYLCRSLDMCLKPALGLMRQKEFKGLTEIKSNDVPLKTVSYGQTKFETHQLPLLKLDCLSIKLGM